MLPSASDTTGINHHGTGVEMARCEQNMNSTNPFCQRRNFVDGVYQLFSRLEDEGPEFGLSHTRNTGNGRKKGLGTRLKGPRCAPSTVSCCQVAWVHMFPAFRRAKISPGIASKMVSKGTWFQSRHGDNRASVAKAFGS